MNDNYRIDSHKLIFHPERVAAWVSANHDWKRVKLIYPIYIEISPIGACNHRCRFCALDYLEYRPNRLEVSIMRGRFLEMVEAGVKSVMFGGEGEPLLHKGVGQMAADAKAAGIDIALTSNGVFLDETFAEKWIGLFSWVKISLNAGTADTYARIHRTRPEDFTTVISNLKRAVRLKKRQGTDVTVGVQILMLPENMAEIGRLAKICRDEIGTDYLVVKPYSQHFFSLTERYKNVDYSQVEELRTSVSTFSTKDFQVLFRSNAMRRKSLEKAYGCCLATPLFWGYVMSTGDVYACSAYLGDERFNLGNLNKRSFKVIWQGDQRKRNFELLQNAFDISTCRINCRMDAINGYLWQLRHPAPHVNFI